MKAEDFNEIVEKRIDIIRETLTSKAEEYADDGERFHNFYVAARVMDVTPEKALLGMWMKHLVSVFDIIENIDNSLPNKELTNEKLGDSIVYNMLLEGLIEDRRNGRENKK